MKAYAKEYRAENGVLFAHLTGTYPNSRLAMKENLFKPLIEECGKNNCSLAIIDARGLQVDFDIAALFRAGVDAAALNQFRLCVALVAREDMLNDFFNDVIRNRGARVEVFTDMESAMVWIDERRPGSSEVA